jgi:ArsR family transcriptional regulator, arsenate/arsenite/antimonite-responsive transcriptional repressor
MPVTLIHPVQPVNQPLEIIKALANDVRFEIVSILAQRECCVCDLEALLDLNQSKVSYHLAVLRDAGLITGEQRGKNSFYKLERVPLYRLGGELLETLFKPRADTSLTNQLNSMC